MPTMCITIDRARVLAVLIVDGARSSSAGAMFRTRCLRLAPHHTAAIASAAGG